MTCSTISLKSAKICSVEQVRGWIRSVAGKVSYRGVQMKVSSLEGGCSRIATTLLILDRFKQTLYPRVENTKGYPRMGLSKAKTQ